MGARTQLAERLQPMALPQIKGQGRRVGDVIAPGMQRQCSQSR